MVMFLKRYRYWIIYRLKQKLYLKKNMMKRLIFDEFYEYINSNKSFIVNYGERHHHGELIATEFNKPISAFNFGRTLFYHYHRFCP